MYKFRYSLLTRDSQPLFHHQRSQVFGSNFRNFETHLNRKTILVFSIRCLVSNVPRDLSFLYRYFYSPSSKVYFKCMTLWDSGKFNNTFFQFVATPLIMCLTEHKRFRFNKNSGKNLLIRIQQVSFFR